MDLKEPLLDKEQSKSNLKKILIACAIVLGIVITIILIIVLQPSEKKTVVIQERETRMFEVFTLDNGLEVTMIHNNNSLEEAFCSISVPAGFLHENGITGLSHLLEHVAFDQTVTKSGERNLFNFIKSKGGDFNAFTAQEETNYYFFVSNNSLLESLDILAEFLKTPSLIDVDVNREVKIVEEEWQWFAADYNWVEQLVYYQNSNPSSNLKYFGIGSQQSFVKDFQNRSISLTQEINNFFNKFYSGSKMKFVVHSAHNSDRLKKYLEDKLGSIPKRGQDKDFEVNQVPFRQQEKQRIFFIESSEERSDLNIFFVIEKDQDDYKTQTWQLIEYLLASTQDNSIVDLLRQQKWAFKVSALFQLKAKNQDVLKLNIQLTDLGLQNWQSVLNLTFYYINEILPKMEDEYLDSVFKSLQWLNKFNFEQKIQSPAEEISEIASNMHNYDIEDIITGQYILYPQNEKEIRQFISKFNQQNSFVSLVTNKLQHMPTLDQQEKQYGLKYTIQQYPAQFQEVSADTKQKLVVPSNLTEFMPKLETDISITEINIRTQWINSDQFWALYYQQIESQFEANVIIQLETKLILTSLSNYTMTYLYSIVLQNYLNEQLAEFTRTGRTIFVGVLSGNLIVLIQGFNDKIGIIASKVLRILKEFRFDENNFYLAKEEVKSYCTIKLYNNDFWAEQYMMKLAITPFYTVYELLNETQSLNFESTKNFIYQEFLPIVFWTVLVKEYEKKPYLQELESYLKTFTGNSSQIDPIQQSYTQFNGSKIYRERNLCIQSRTSIIKSYYMATFMNTSLFSINNQYYNLLITYQLVYNQIFYVLRRHETLAYSPSCIFEISPDLTWFYFQIQVLSHNYSPEYLSSRIQNLIYDTYNSLALQANFKILQSKVELIKSKFRSLKQKTRKDLKRIFMEVYKYEDSLLLQNNILDNQIELLSKFINLQTDELSSFEEFMQLYQHIFKLSPRIEIQIYRQGIEIPNMAYPDNVGNFSSLVEGIKETEVILNYFKSFELFDQKNQLRQSHASQSKNSTQTVLNLDSL